MSPSSFHALPPERIRSQILASHRLLLVSHAPSRLSSPQSSSLRFCIDVAYSLFRAGTKPFGNVFSYLWDIITVYAQAFGVVIILSYSVRKQIHVSRSLCQVIVGNSSLRGFRVIARHSRSETCTCRSGDPEGSPKTRRLPSLCFSCICRRSRLHRSVVAVAPAAIRKARSASYRFMDCLPESLPGCIHSVWPVMAGNSGFFLLLTQPCSVQAGSAADLWK